MLYARLLIVIMMSLASTLVIPTSLPSAVNASEHQTASQSPQQYAIGKLRSAGLPYTFIADIAKTHIPDERDRIVELNVLGFLGKADYSSHYSKTAIKKCRAFIHKNQRRLKLVEKTYGIPKEVIAALLWVETKHGKTTGSHNIGHVYFSLLQADHPAVLEATLRSLAQRSPAGIEENKQKVIDRSIAKSNWALDQLKAMNEIYNKTPSRALKLKGSFAGAFGIPQFVPSSYLQWARSSRKNREPNLFKTEDAIQSVAFYLNANGWQKADPLTHQQALFHYNRAQGYVDVILNIASHVQNAHY
jgi:membrane-bound lytic murein transglycosylase B